MNSVTYKNLAKRKKHWWRVRVHFDQQPAADDNAMRCALRLREQFLLVYFARYNSDTHYVEYAVQCCGAKGVPREQVKIVKTIADALMASTVVPKFTVDTPIAQSGSEAHGHAFDTVAGVIAGTLGCTPLQRKAAIADVVHWMHNMAGLDYLDEARQAIHTLGRIVDMIQPVAPKKGS